MKWFFGILTVLFSISGLAATRYVDPNSTNSTAPYTDWSTAATNIQDAIDASTNGDLVVVTNGVYSTGGITMDGSQTNRVSLNSAITVQSVNGPWVTTIEGSGALLGPASVRCAWLTNNATLIGFTLTGGAVSTSESGGGAWCASSNAIIANCVIASNYSYFNAAGVVSGALNNCLLTGNVAADSGAAGAAQNSILNSCTFYNNSNPDGPALYECKATNCIVYSNSLENYGGASALNYCCTTPLPSGPGNFTNAPQLFADGVHLAAGSPCIGAGTNVVTGTDIFGVAWSNPPSIGCAEWQPAPYPVVFGIQFSNYPMGFEISGGAAGEPPFSFMWIKDGTLLQDGSHFSGTQTSNLFASGLSPSDEGEYQLIASNAFGVSTSLVATLTIHFVDASATNATPPYSDWTTAAPNIQDAVNIAGRGDLILVTNGIYTNGGITVDGIVTNRVTLNKAVKVESVNGPCVTTIEGVGTANGPSAVRCALLTNNAALVGFTLEWGATATTGGTTTSESGGGVWCAGSNAIVANCVIESNNAYYEGSFVYGGTLNNCYVSENAGGTFGSYLLNCTVVSNSGTGISGYTDAGGATNCIVYYNTETLVAVDVGFSHCCLITAKSGPGNFTTAPGLFADGIHLGQGSPCIHTGAPVATGVDIFGQPWANPPSIGCAEWQLAPVILTPQIRFSTNGVGFVITNAVTDGQTPFSYFWLFNGAPVKSNGQFSGTQTSGLVTIGASFADAGNYQLVVSNAYGVATSAVVSLVAHCVNGASTNPVPPYTNWATAATNIQNAIDSANAGDLVIVTNGVYTDGYLSEDGTITNTVTLNKAIIVASVNGWTATTIQGQWAPVNTNGLLAVRCAWLTNNATLMGFTLENGATRSTGGASEQGGGAWCASSSAQLYNCALSNNSAVYGAGICSGTLNNSLEVMNVAASEGGGAYNATLNNCTLQNNWTTPAIQNLGAGTYNCNVRNSIVVGNYSGSEEGPEVLDDYYVQPGFYYYSNSFTEWSLSAPAGGGNLNGFNVNPQLLDLYHISVNSPCRGAGNAAYSTGTDLDGETWSNPPSMGCSEVVVSNLIGPLTASIEPYYTNVLVNTPTIYTGEITGRASQVEWLFSGGAVVTNAGGAVSHYWTNAGPQTVSLRVYNDTYPSGILTSLSVLVYLPAPVTLAAPNVNSSGIEFSFPAQLEANYVVQYTTNLTPPIVWHTLETVDLAPPFPIQVTDAATNTERFYRVIAQ